jgi:hypothetical protein
VQDDWKIHPRLTLNLGLRYEFSLPWLGDRFNGVTFHAGQQSTVVPSAPAGLVFGGDAGGFVNQVWPTFGIVIWPTSIL